MEQTKKIPYSFDKCQNNIALVASDIEVNQKLNNFIHENIKKAVGIRGYLYYLQNIVFTALNKNVLAIIGKDKQSIESVYDKYNMQICKLVSSTWRDVKVSLKYCYIKNEKLEEVQFESQFIEKPNSQIVHFNEFENKYSFDTFVSSEENITALEVCQSIACFSQKELVFGGSVVCIYGGASTGKTHLVNAVNNFYKSQGGKVFNISANNFLRKYIEAVKEQNVFKFHDNILENEIIIIDDVSDLIGKNGTLSELSRILTTAIENKKYIILTSSIAPNQLSEKSSVLHQILTNAMSLKLSEPKEALKTQVVMNYICEKNFNVPISIVKDLILKFDCNIIELKNYVKKLAIVQSIRKFELNSNLAFEILKDDLKENDNNKYVSNEEILDIVAKYYNLSSQELRSKIKRENVCRARNVAMYLMKKINSANFQEIGRALNRNHSTVIAGLRNIENWMKIDKKLPAELADLTAKCR